MDLIFACQPACLDFCVVAEKGVKSLAIHLREFLLRVVDVAAGFVGGFNSFGEIDADGFQTSLCQCAQFLQFVGFGI
jgi:hypothetical protein